MLFPRRLPARQSSRCGRILPSGWNGSFPGGDVSPAGFWYDQEETEWVSLLSGCALLEFSGCIVFLERGDTLRIPAHKKHRVAATSVSPACIWLCLFGKEREECGS